MEYEKYKKKILIGGKAMNIHGSTRLTEDTDYLVFDETTFKPFLRNEKMNIDYVNANGHNFFNEIYEIEKENQIASPQSVLELKAYSYVQHLLNGNFEKAAQTDYDIKFLILRYKLEKVDIAKKYLSKSELEEIESLLKSIKKPNSN